MRQHALRALIFSQVQSKSTARGEARLTSANAVSANPSHSTDRGVFIPAQDVANPMLTSRGSVVAQAVVCTPLNLHDLHLVHGVTVSGCIDDIQLTIKAI